MCVNLSVLNLFKKDLVNKVEKAPKIENVNVLNKDNKDIYIHDNEKKEKKEKFFVLCGASCCGKDTLLNYLKEKYNLNTLISYTTRPQRINEVDGKDYYFVKKNKFINMIESNEFIEYKRYVATRVGDKKEVWFYGTSKEEFEKTNRKIGILDVSGIKKIQDYYGKENVVIIFVECEKALRESRAKNRKDYDVERWANRCAFDDLEFSKKFVKEEVNFVIHNNNDKDFMMLQADNIMKAYNIKPIK